MEALSKAASQVSKATRSRAAFDLKGVVTPLTVIRLRTRDLNMVDRQLRAKTTQMPQFFQDAPVVVDFAELDGGPKDLSFGTLVHMLRACRLVPVGATNLAAEYLEAARLAGLGVITLGGRGREDTRGEPDVPAPGVNEAVTVEAAAYEEPAPPPAPRPASRKAAPGPKTTTTPSAETMPAALPQGAHLGPVVVRQPVRSGQVIYARNTDLIVLAAVNPGAQIFADGHIHVYAPLRGRAMAGAQGRIDARIFVQKLEAELVAIAGAYIIPDDVPEYKGKAAQVYLENGECRITAL